MKSSKKILFNELLIGLLVLALTFQGLFFFNILGKEGFLWNISNYSLWVISIIGVIPVVISAIRALLKRSVTVDLLASIALIFTLLEGHLVSAVFINLMLASARLFGAFTERKTENILTSLLKLRPDKVKIKEGEYEKEIKIEDVKKGDLVVVGAGDRIPIDGFVVSGQASIDQSTLTGESEPLSKNVGSEVFSSTLCLTGSLVVRAEKVGEDTTLSKMIALVDDASRAKTKTETFANKFSAWYITITLVGTGIIFLITRNLDMVLSVLLVTCADDLAVAIPLGFSVAISKAAKHGIVIKGATIMERLKDITTIVTDKTGTLTKGTPRVVRIYAVGELSEEKVLEEGAICSMYSKHPASQAIVEYAKEKNIKAHSPDKVEEIPGEGIWVKHDENEYWEGKISYLTQNGIEIDEKNAELISQITTSGMSITALAMNKKIIGIFALEDEIRKYAKDVILETKELGIKNWIMLTGDNKTVASRVSNTLGLDEFYGDLKPEDKLEIIKKLRQKHGAVAMIGDGVNDAAALALADVSFAMGTIGSDASIDAADVAIMHDDLRRIPEAIFLSKESIKIVKQNFIIWGISNAVGLGLVFGGILGPVGASLFNFLTDFIPISNVFKIYRLKINKHTYDVEK